MLTGASGQRDMWHSPAPAQDCFPKSRCRYQASHSHWCWNAARLGQPYTTTQRGEAITRTNSVVSRLPQSDDRREMTASPCIAIDALVMNAELAVSSMNRVASARVSGMRYMRS